MVDIEAIVLNVLFVLMAMNLMYLEDCTLDLVRYSTTSALYNNVIFLIKDH